MEDDRRRAPRQDLNGTVEFALDAHDVLEAEALDISEVGIGFTTDEPLTVAVTVNVDGREVTRRARLMRATRGDDGKWSFGLEFIAHGSEASD